jgi:hypothetical protein
MSNPQKSKAWAAYFLLMCVVFVLGLFSGTQSVASLVNSILTGVSLIGLWGYMSQEAIGPRAVWAVLFFAQVLGVVATSLLLFFSSLPAAIPVIAAALTLPLLVALFRYAFRSRNIWPAGTAEA